jgi:hypothetical protein
MSDDVITVITQVCQSGDTFPQKVERIYAQLAPWDVLTLAARLNSAGVIPERYEHDSSEEKLYAKYCDILVAEAFKAMGYRAVVNATRSNAADLYIEGLGYSVVCDVKAFRLSRTALNPKDYKIEAVDRWRRNQEAGYAFLVAPHPQFPKDISRLYDEALRYSVTLLSFAHIEFLVQLAKATHETPDLRPLWELARQVEAPGEIRGPSYWAIVDRLVLRLQGATEEGLIDCRSRYERAFREQAALQVAYWESRLAEIHVLPREQLVERLIQAEGIEGKIKVIKQYLT